MAVVTGEKLKGVNAVHSGPGERKERERKEEEEGASVEGNRLLVSKLLSFIIIHVFGHYGRQFGVSDVTPRVADSRIGYGIRSCRLGAETLIASSSSSSLHSENAICHEYFSGISFSFYFQGSIATRIMLI